MKKMFFAVVSAMLGVSAAYAQPHPPRGDPAEREAMMNAAFSALANMDAATRVQLLKQFDKDGDGRLSKEERAEAMRLLREKTADLEDLRQKHAEGIIKKFDKDGDGKLGIEEVMAFLDEQRKMFEDFRSQRLPRDIERNIPKDVLAKFDKDGDGKLSREERREMFMQARRKHQELMNKFDKDGDGHLSDSEKDDLLNSSEFKSMMKQMMGDGIRFRMPSSGNPTPPQQR